jgi:deoxycytidine triphosphate deaminase
MWLLKIVYYNEVHQLMFETLEQVCNYIYKSQNSYKYEIIYLDKSL